MIQTISINDFEFIYINNFWQIPVITELQIFKNFYSNKTIPYHFISFPWASYIDNKYHNKYDNLKETIDNEVINKNIISRNVRYFTVCQHIEFRQYLLLFKQLNIKYIFTPHKMIGDDLLEKEHDLFIIPISLFPKQNNSLDVFIEPNQRKYLSSFVGQVVHKDMISNIREKIFENFNDKSDCLIKKNDKWYYQDNVYSEKKNILSDNDIIYKQTLLDSKFSLCPLGTGPNSIRLWESLSFGSIPVILSDKLVLPNLGINYEECFIIWREADINELYDYLLHFDEEKIINMSKKCVELYQTYFSELNMHKPILYYFENLLE